MFCLSINHAVQNKHLAMGMTGFFYMYIFTPSGNVSLWVSEIEEGSLDTDLNAAFIKLCRSLVCVCLCVGRWGGLFRDLTPLMSFVMRALERQE